MTGKPFSSIDTITARKFFHHLLDNSSKPIQTYENPKIESMSRSIEHMESELRDLKKKLLETKNQHKAKKKPLLSIPPEQRILHHEIRKLETIYRLIVANSNTHPHELETVKHRIDTAKKHLSAKQKEYRMSIK